MREIWMKYGRRCLALALCVVSCVACLSGCGEDETAERTGLTVCVGEEPATYDPIYAQEIGDQTILNHLYENLLRLERDENGDLIVVSGAAKSVDHEENADGTVTYTFRLRGGKWSDGVEVKASDFVYAWQRLADPATGSAYASLLSIVSGYDAARASGDMTLLAVTAKNSSTLVVTLDGHYDWFLREVCTSTATMPLRQDVVRRLKQAADEANEAAGEAGGSLRWWSDPTKLVTNGAYTVQEEKENFSLTLGENPSYGKKLTGPENLVFRFADQETAQALYAQGEVDAIWPLSEEEMAQRMEADETWTAEPVLGTYTVLFNCGALQDEHVRQALSLAIDRPAIAALAGVTAQAAEGLVPPGVYHETEDGAQDPDFRGCGGELLENDPAWYPDRCLAAAELLRDASEEPETMEYLYIDEGSNGAVAAALCEQWARVLELDVTPRAVTQAELMTALREGSYTLAGMEVTAVCNDAECFLSNWTSGSGDNFLHYENSAYDTLMSIIAGAEEGTARLGCLHDAEDLLVQIDSALAPLYTVGTAWELRETYAGGFRDPRGWFDFRSVYMKPVTVS